MEAPARGGDAASSPCACSPLPVRGGDPPAHPLRQAAREDSGNPAAGPDRAGDARSWPPSGPGHPLPPSQARAKDAAAARAAGLRHADHDALYAARLEQPCGIRRARVSVRRVVERPDGTRSGEFLVRGGKGESIRCFADMALPVPADKPVCGADVCRASGDLQCADRRPRLRRGVGPHDDGPSPAPVLGPQLRAVLGADCFRRLHLADGRMICLTRNSFRVEDFGRPAGQVRWPGRIIEAESAGPAAGPG